MANTRLFIFLACITAICACKSNLSPTTEADKAYNTMRYFTAASLYKKAVARVPKEEKAPTTFKVAECYRLMNNTKQSEIWYDKAIKAGYTEPKVYLNFAQSLQTNEKYDLAIEQYNLYLQQNPLDSVAKNGVLACKNIIEWMKKPANFEVFNETGVNSKEIDFSPAYYGKGILFTSTREPAKGKNVYQWTGKGFTNIYASAKNDKNKWEKAELLTKDINSKYNEGVCSFDNTNKILYYTQCNGVKGKEKECKIWQTKNDGEKWTEGAPIKMNTLDTAYTFGHPCISTDGTKLYFSSDIPGGFGGHDLYYCEKEGDGWGKPVNMGNVVNTAGDEEFPFVHQDGTLYYASNGFNGIGGFDLYMAELEDGKYTEPLNLKYPTNSTSDDFGLILDEKKETGYMTSNRPGGKGEDDIYSVINIPVVFTISGKAINALTNKPLAETTITIASSDGKEETVTTDKVGFYKIRATKNTNYELAASKKRYFGDRGTTTTVGLRESKELVVNFKLSQIPLSEIQLKGILYDLNKADLRPESEKILDTLINTLNDNPSFVIELASHTDSRATKEYNDTLSQKRAQSVVDYLVAHKIEPARLVAKGYGETQLLNKCADGVECTEEEHQQNRRTTFRILSEDYVSKNKPKVPQAPKPKGKK